MVTHVPRGLLPDSPNMSSCVIMYSVSRVKVFSAFAAGATGVVCLTPPVTALADNTPSKMGNWVSRETMSEQWTGTKFPIQLEDDPVGEVPYTLLGASVRCMLGLCSFAPARGYAFGIYVRPTDGLKSTVTLANLNSDKASHEERKDEEGNVLPPIVPDALDALCQYPVDKCIRLVFVRDVAGPHISKGFSRSLYNRIRDLNGGKKESAGKDALRQLCAVFLNKQNMETGTEVRLVISGKDDSIKVVIDGQEAARVPGERTLVLAILDMYLGSNAVSPEGRQAVFDGINKVLLSE
eukprot:TRINITY_DN1427_c0_g1_i1.p1 TRINITY_DN1427_c0_g1~~TRINITY_DN1427_c0_g1_i1.p1  ORF type:complete len:295 (-),score=56.86 TRINITY_DN1427_c0_g1_i1:46-930(-)